MCTSSILFAQNQRYTGNIYSQEDKKPLDGVIITLLDQGNVYITDPDGSFDFDAPQDAKALISHLGFEEKTITLSSEYQKIYLLPSSEKLEELIISKTNNINDIDIRNSTGSVVSIDMTKLSNKSELDMARLLQGQASGLTVNMSGELGKRPEIRIRGNSSFSYKGSANEPLFVMDGIIISTENFLTLNPSDFSTIKILKDAPATALYGIKAANGVIELTSKKGYDGKPIFNFSVKQGMTLRGERTARMMNTTEKLAFEERMEIPNAPGYLKSESYIRKTYANDPKLQEYLNEGKHYLDSLKQINTDWFKELIKPNYFQSYNLSVRGGTAKNTYFYSTSYSKQGGRIPGNDIDQITARMNLDYSLGSNFYLSLNNSFGISKTNTQNGMDNDPTSIAYDLNPYETKLTKNLISFPNRSFSDLENQYKEKNNSKRFSSALILHWDISPDLNISGVFGGDYNITDSNHRIYSYAYSQKDKNAIQKGYIKESDSKNFDFSYNIRANYQKQFGEHDIFIGANIDYLFTDIKAFSASGHGIADDIESLSGINPTLPDPEAPKNSGSKQKIAQIGYGIATGYTFQNTYDFYASFKRDGSSMLPENERWNNAWSIGIGWSPSEYSFFKSQQILTSLRFKSSIGYTASLAGISARDIINTYSYSNNFYGDNRLLSLLGLPNQELKPQQTFTTNFSVTLGFIDRLNIQTNLYRNLTKEAIISIPIAPSNGFINYTKNIGELENNGIEITLSGDIIQTTNFKWNSALSFSYNKNKVLKLYGTDRIYLSEESAIPEYEVGRPLGVTYGLTDIGIYPLNGIPQYIDNDGNIIDHETNRATNPNYFKELGYSIPPYNGFFNQYFTYKNWSLAVDINYSLGGIKTYSKTYVRDKDNSNKNAIKGQLENMWFEVGDEDKIYPIKNLPSQAYDFTEHPSTNTIYKTDYFKLNYIQLGYNFSDNKYIQKYFKSFQLHLQADNLYVFRIEKDRGSLNDVLQPVITFGINATF